ncbi:OmpA family protein [Nitrosomonas sp.]|uniref:OmpA family protein n=3 Tax=Nitrosomonas sp. TaxID=42353 RepID=UPI00284BCA20|nr:OmpA family protein [Nitrosomonas sp.]MCP5242279.1 OmpA family protein [Burkholderiales bacterium]MDR4514139.1 OmpA family protein [Nitrosomonas sp.]
MQRYLLVVIATGLIFSGCASMSETQRGTAQGSLAGAAAGALIGGLAGDGKGAAIGAAAGAAAGAAGGYMWSKRLEEQKRQMEAVTQGTGVQVSQTADNRLKLDIPSDITFDTGRAQIKPNMKPILDSFAASLMQNPSAQVTIIGHTDSSGSDAINNPLSVNRAASTRDYLVQRGVPYHRIQIDGRGEYEPIASNDTPAGRAMNRRVEVFVYEPAPQQAPPPPPQGNPYDRPY